ncbi:hypothetical protein V8E36_004003 [Tilletia maclaganii]
MIADDGKDTIAHSPLPFPPTYTKAGLLFGSRVGRNPAPASSHRHLLLAGKWPSKKERSPPSRTQERPASSDIILRHTLNLWGGGACTSPHLKKISLMRQSGQSGRSRRDRRGQEGGFAFQGGKPCGRKGDNRTRVKVGRRGAAGSEIDGWTCGIRCQPAQPSRCAFWGEDATDWEVQPIQRLEHHSCLHSKDREGVGKALSQTGDEGRMEGRARVEPV